MTSINLPDNLPLGEEALGELLLLSEKVQEVNGLKKEASLAAVIRLGRVLVEVALEELEKLADEENLQYNEELAVALQFALRLGIRQKFVHDILMEEYSNAEEGSNVETKPTKPN